MKMKALYFALLGLIWISFSAYAEDTAAAPPAATPSASQTTQTTTTTVTAQATAVTEAAKPTEAAVTATTAPAPVQATVATTAEPKAAADAAENLEFVSGEISAADAAAKTITVKLYGETENESKEKTISVKVDGTTDITDGEKDRDFKSLTSGTEVDVEYDPTSNKATYIFVY